MADTTIAWTEKVWNIATGCTKVSSECQLCYIERTPPFRIAGKKFVHGKIPIELHESRLDAPLHWKKPCMVFVNSMSDLFHADIPDEFIDKVFAVMALCHQHTFQILTKRAERLPEWFDAINRRRCGYWCEHAGYLDDLIVNYGILSKERANRLHLAARRHWHPELPEKPTSLGDSSITIPWPLPNVWLGVSCGNRKDGLPRLDILRTIPAAVRFVSFEPLLEDLGKVDLTEIQWAIIGGESGHGARPCDLSWIRSLVRQCREAGTHPFVNQLGANIIDRNDAGFDADAHVYAEGPDEGKPVDEGAWPYEPEIEEDLDGTRDGYQGAPVRVRLRDKNGGDMEEWPLNVRVREFPREGGR